MKSLPTLKRLQDFKLDESKRRLGELNKKLSQAEDDLRAMLEEHQHQQDTKKLYIKDSPQLDGDIYGNYVQAVEERRMDYLKKMAELNRDIFLETEEMHKIFREVKKLDLLEEEMLAREKAELQKKEDQFMDEVGARKKGFK